MKIKLNLDTLSVDSFETGDVAELGRGTVQAHQMIRSRARTNTAIVNGC